MIALTLSHSVFSIGNINDDHQSLPYTSSPFLENPSQLNHTNKSTHQGKETFHTHQHDIPDVNNSHEETPSDIAEQKARSKLVHISHFTDGILFRSCEEGKGYLTHLSQDPNLTDQEFHELLNKESTIFPETAFNEIYHYHNQSYFIQRVESEPKSPEARLLIAFGLEMYCDDIDIINALFGLAVESGQWYFVDYIDEWYKDLFSERYNMPLTQQDDIEFMMKHGNKYHDAHFFNNIIARSPKSFLCDNRIFSHFLNLAANINRTDFAKILIQFHPAYAVKSQCLTKRKAIRNKALSTAFAKRNLDLIQCLVPKDETKMLSVKKSPLLDALKLEYKDAIKYFLSFQEIPKTRLATPFHNLISDGNLEGIKLLCGYDNCDALLSMVFTKAANAHHLNVIQYLVEERGIQVTTQHLQNFITHINRNKKSDKKNIEVPLFLIKENETFIPLGFINIVMFYPKTDKRKELISTIAQKIIQNPLYKMPELLDKFIWMTSKTDLFEGFLSGIEDVDDVDDLMQCVQMEQARQLKSFAKSRNRDKEYFKRLSNKVIACIKKFKENPNQN